MSTEKRTLPTKPSADREAIPGFAAWLEANRGRFKAGSVKHILILHDEQCRYPWGRPCTCRLGPEINVAGEDPEAN
jgi:hypothetical protein